LKRLTRDGLPVGRQPRKAARSPATSLSDNPLRLPLASAGARVVAWLRMRSSANASSFTTTSRAQDRELMGKRRQRRRRTRVHRGRPVRGSRCPSCSKLLDAASGVSDDSDRNEMKPSEGDVTVCVYCGAVLRFRAGLKLELPTKKELAKLRKSPSWELLRKIRISARALAVKMHMEESGFSPN
jgi:hypothetical protein